MNTTTGINQGQKRTHDQQDAPPSSAASGGAAGGAKGDIKDFNIDDIKAGDIVGDGLAGVITSDVQNNTQIHHKTRTMANASGDYRITIDTAFMGSNFILSFFENKVGAPQSAGLKTFIDIYGDYDTLDSKGMHTTDPLGDQLAAGFERIRLMYAESVDANPQLKRTILAKLKVGKDLDRMMGEPFANLLDDWLRMPLIENVPETDPTFGTLDTSKSPSGKFGLWASVPKEPSVNHLLLAGTPTALWTRIFYHKNGVISKKPLATFEELTPFIYQKGDSQTYGRRPFRMNMTFILLPPSVYLNSNAKRGELQYKCSEIHIHGVEEPKARNAMSDAESERMAAVMQRAKQRFPGLSAPEPTLVEPPPPPPPHSGVEQGSGAGAPLAQGQLNTEVPTFLGGSLANPPLPTVVAANTPVLRGWPLMKDGSAASRRDDSDHDVWPDDHSVPSDGESGARSPPSTTTTHTSHKTGGDKRALKRGKHQ